MFEYHSTIGVSESGGFELMYYLNNSASYSQALDVFFNLGWIDHQTGAIYIDFVLYNGHMDMLSYVSFEFLFDESGLVTPALKFRSMGYEFYRDGIDIFRAVLEAVYVILLILYTAIQLYQIKVNIISEKVALQSAGIDVHSAKIFMFWRGIKKHFSELWNIMDLTSIILSYVDISLWITIANGPIAHMGTYDINTNSSLTNDLLDTLATYILYTRLNSVNLLLIFFRLIRYLGKFERIRLLNVTLVRAKGEIFYFSVLLFGIFISFVIFSHVAFGGIVEEYSSVGVAFTSCFLILFNNLDTIEKILKIDFERGAFFVILFTLIINFILLSMFIAIIGNAYSEQLDNLDKARKNKPKQDEKHIIFTVVDWSKEIYFKILGVFSKKRAIISKFKSKEPDDEMDNPDEVIKLKNYGIDYNDAKLYGAMIDHEVLTDKEKFVKVSESALILSKKLWAALIFVTFAIIYTVTLLDQQDLFTRYQLTKTFKNSIEFQMFNVYYNLEDTRTFYYLADWIRYSFIANFPLNGYYQMEQNYLVGQNFNNTDLCADTGPVRMTVRKVDYTDNPSNIFDSVEPMKRYPKFSAFETDPPNEFKETLNVGCLWEYQSDVSLYNGGGYIFYLFTDINT